MINNNKLCNKNEIESRESNNSPLCNFHKDIFLFHRVPKHDVLIMMDDNRNFVNRSHNEMFLSDNCELQLNDYRAWKRKKTKKIRKEEIYAWNKAEQLISKFNVMFSVLFSHQ